MDKSHIRSSIQHMSEPEEMLLTATFQGWEEEYSD